MKKLFVFSTLLFVMLGIFASCQKENRPSEQYIKETILGKWRQKSINGKDIVTNYGTVETYNPDGDGRISAAWGNDWAFQMGGMYTISGNQIIKYSKKPGETDKGRVETVVSIDNSSYEISVDVEVPEGGIVPFESGTWKYIRINADYHVSIIGTWEGVEMTGEETYGDFNHRWEYKSDRTYVYYVKDKGGNWIASQNVDNEYFVDGDFLASRWKNNAESDYNYEWWDITSCNSTEMTWSALREKEDGTRYTTTFKMKRIE